MRGLFANAIWKMVTNLRTCRPAIQRFGAQTNLAYYSYKNDNPVIDIRRQSIINVV